MNVDLKRCPHSDKHRVYGGFPEYVCPTCATQWVVVNFLDGTYCLYEHFNSDGKIVRRWREKLGKRGMLETARRTLAV